MKLSKLQDTFTNEYLIVIDSEGAEVLLLILLMLLL